jgi:hypothetical protein
MTKRTLWIWCYIAFKLYLWLPTSLNHKTLYGRFALWLLGYAGAYAHSKDFRDFDEHCFND